MALCFEHCSGCFNLSRTENIFDVLYCRSSAALILLNIKDATAQRLISSRYTGSGSLLSLAFAYVRERGLSRYLILDTETYRRELSVRSGCFSKDSEIFSFVPL